MASLDSIEVGDKKNRVEILDLSQINIYSKSDLNKLLERVPDFKVRSERVRTEDVQTGVEYNTAESAIATAKTTPVLADYQFSNPIPMSLREVCLKELGRVNISWRMLTLARPKTKVEEDFFSRLVQLEKLQFKTIQWEMDKTAIKDKKSNDSSSSGNRNTGRGGGGNRGSSVAEKRMQTCKECGVEFCAGKCKNFLYDDFARTFNPITNDIFEIVKKSTSNLKKGATDKLKKGKTNTGKVLVNEESNAVPSSSQSEQAKNTKETNVKETRAPLKPGNTKKRIAKTKVKKTKQVNNTK